MAAPDPRAYARADHKIAVAVEELGRRDAGVEHRIKKARAVLPVSLYISGLGLETATQSVDPVLRDIDEANLDPVYLRGDVYEADLDALDPPGAVKAIRNLGTREILGEVGGIGALDAPHVPGRVEAAGTLGALDPLSHIENPGSLETRDIPGRVKDACGLESPRIPGDVKDTGAHEAIGVPDQGANAGRRKGDVKIADGHGYHGNKGDKNRGVGDFLI